MIKKITELYFEKNDIYILESHNNTIIVNDNAQGLLLFDSTLHIKGKLSVLQETSIYFLYKKYDGSAIILYLPDDHQIIYINLKTGQNYTIYFSEALAKDILSPNYYWVDNILILTTFNNDFYQLDFASQTLHPISNNTIQKLCPSFLIFWNICKKYNLLKVYPDKQCFVFQKNNTFIEYFDYQQNNDQAITGFSNGWHDVEYNNNTFLFIHEKKIEILSNNPKNILTPHTNFIFLKAKFLTNNQFVVLSSNPSNYQESLLEIYTIDIQGNK